MRILHPEVFQGSLSREEYFEGWYFKQVRADGSAALACIPGISLHGSDRHAFVQVIDGQSGSTWYIRYELSECSYTTAEFSVSIGPNTFSRAGMHLEIDRQGLSLHGELSFSGTVRYPASLAAPNIMDGIPMCRGWSATMRSYQQIIISAACSRSTVNPWILPEGGAI